MNRSFIIFFYSIFSLLLRLGNFYSSVFRFTNSLLCHLYSAIYPIQWAFKILVIVFYNSKISIWFFFIFSNSFCWFRKTISSITSIFFFYLIQHSYNGCLKVLVWKFPHLSRLKIGIWGFSFPLGMVHTFLALPCQLILDIVNVLL